MVFFFFLFFFFPFLLLIFFRCALFVFCIECFAEKMEKRVRKILSGGKVQGTDDLSGVENAVSGDQEHAKKKGKLVITSFFLSSLF